MLTANFPHLLVKQSSSAGTNRLIVQCRGMVPNLGKRYFLNGSRQKHIITAAEVLNDPGLYDLKLKKNFVKGVTVNSILTSRPYYVEMSRNVVIVPAIADTGTETQNLFCGEHSCKIERIILERNTFTVVQLKHAIPVYCGMPFEIHNYVQGDMEFSGTIVLTYPPDKLQQKILNSLKLSDILNSAHTVPNLRILIRCLQGFIWPEEDNGTLEIDPAYAQRMLTRILHLLSHKTSMSKTELQRQIPECKIFDELLKLYCGRGDIGRTGNQYFSTTGTSGFAPYTKKVLSDLETFGMQGTPFTYLKQPGLQEQLQILVLHKKVRELGSGLYILETHLQQLLNLCTVLKKNRGTFTIQDLRAETGLSRRILFPVIRLFEQERES